MKFDPITGEMIDETAQQPSNQENGTVAEMPIEQPNDIPAEQPPVVPQADMYNPNPDYSNATNPDSVNQNAYIPNPEMGIPPYGQPYAPQQAPGYVNPEKKKTKLPLIIGIAAAAVAVVVLVVVLISSGVFLGKGGKVLKATYKTFKDVPHFVEALEPLSILKESKYTVGISGERYGNKANAEIMVKGNEKQMSVLLDYDGYDKVEALLGINTKSAKIQVPAVSKYNFVYNYKQDNGGYLVEEADDIEVFNSLLETIATGDSKVDEFNKDFVKVWTDELGKLTFEDAEKDEYSVDDQDVMCKGYSTIISCDNAISIIDGMESVINEYYASLVDIGMINGGTITEYFEELRDDYEDMSDIEASFYIYKGMLAAIKLTNEDDDKIEICFEGGDYRLQNINIKSGSRRVQIKGDDSGTKEKFVVKERNGGYSNEIANLEYNYENGRITGYINGYSLNGKLNKTDSGMVVKLDSVRIPRFLYSYNIDNFEFKISKGADMKKFSGKEYDLGNADEDEIIDLREDIRDKIYDEDINFLYDLLNRLRIPIF